MTIVELLNKVENDQKIAIELVTQSIENRPAGCNQFISYPNKFAEELKPHLQLEIYSVSVGPRDTLWIKI